MNNKTFIIAEIGVNHNGNIDLAMKLIDKAKSIGVDAVKFQTFIPEKIATRNSIKADYQYINSNDIESQFEMLKKLALDFDDFKIIKNHCLDNDILFLSSPFDIESAELLKELNLDIIKIPSGEITNLPYLEKIGSFNKKIILSTGMSNIKDISDALDILVSKGTLKSNISLLHATSEYPTPFEDVNLQAIKTLKNHFKLKVGFSDHTIGIEASIGAICFGAEIIEKHFTLDCSMDGPDHKASTEPEEFKKMITAIRNIEKALGDGKKELRQSEKKNIKIVRKSIVANKEISKNEIFTDKNITTKRPGNGISPMHWYKIIGTRAKKKYKKDDLI